MGGRADDQVWEAIRASFWIQMLGLRKFSTSTLHKHLQNVLIVIIWIQNEPDRAFQRWRGRTWADGRTGRRPGLGECRGLILDPNDNCEDILEVLMKCRC